MDKCIHMDEFFSVRTLNLRAADINIYFLFFKFPTYQIQCIVQTNVVVATEANIEKEILTSTSDTNVGAKKHSSVHIV